MDLCGWGALAAAAAGVAAVGAGAMLGDCGILFPGMPAPGLKGAADCGWNAMPFDGVNAGMTD